MSARGSFEALNALNEGFQLILGEIGFGHATETQVQNDDKRIGRARNLIRPARAINRERQ